MNQYKSINRMFLIMVIVYLGAANLIGLLPMTVKMNEYQLSILSQILIFMVPFFYCKIKNIHVTKELGFHKVRVSTILLVILCTILLYPLLSLINTISSLFVTSGTAYMMDMLSPQSLGLNLLFIAIIPAIVEETVFRGVIFGQYKKSGVFIGALFSSFTFGCMHMNFNQFAYTFVLGIYLALLVEVTGSILSSMVAHFVINGGSTLMVTLVMGTPGYQAAQDAAASQRTDTMATLAAIVMLSFLAVLTTAAAIGVFTMICHQCKGKGHMKQMLQYVKIRRVTIPYVLAVLICIGYMILVEVLVR